MSWELPYRRVDPYLIEQVANLILHAATEQIQAAGDRESIHPFNRDSILPSNRVSTEPNLNFIKRLYQPNQHLRRMEERRVEKLYKEVKQLRDFKVENQVSKKMNRRNPSKPIFERTPDIIKDREQKISVKKMNIESIKALEREKSGIKSRNLDKENRQRKINMAEFAQKQKHLEHQRNLYLNERRLQELNQTYSHLKAKPSLTEETQHIVKQSRYANKKVLDRFDEHYLRKRHHDMMRLKKITETETPFNPSINKKSQYLASRSFSNLRSSSSVFDRVSRNPSRDCIKRGCLDHLRDNEIQTAYKEYKDRSRSKSKSKPNLMNMTFSSPRVPMRSLSKNEFSKSKNKSSLTRSKVNLKHIDSCDFIDEENQNVEAKRLKKIIYGNKKEVISFVKQLIIKDKILES